MESEWVSEWVRETEVRESLELKGDAICADLGINIRNLAQTAQMDAYE